MNIIYKLKYNKTYCVLSDTETTNNSNNNFDYEQTKGGIPNIKTTKNTKTTTTDETKNILNKQLRKSLFPNSNPPAPNQGQEQGQEQNQNQQEENVIDTLKRLLGDLNINGEEMDEEALTLEYKRYMIRIMLHFLIGYGIGFIIYNIVLYFYRGRFVRTRFVLFILYLFAFTATIGMLLNLELNEVHE